MISRLSVFLCAIFIVSLVALNVMGSDTASQREGQKVEKVFTNEDLKAYKSPQDNKTAPPKVAERREEKKDGLKKIQEEIDSEKWCKRGTSLRKKIEKAQDQVDNDEGKIADLKKENSEADFKRQKSNEKRIKRLEKDLEKSHKKLKYAQKDLSDLEDEAHRKGVLPGWLRCQY